MGGSTMPSCCRSRFASTSSRAPSNAPYSATAPLPSRPKSSHCGRAPLGDGLPLAATPIGFFFFDRLAHFVERPADFRDRGFGFGLQADQFVARLAVHPDQFVEL